MKLAWSNAEEPRRGWRAEIIRFRRDLEATLTPTIRAKVEGELERLHVSAAAAVSEDLADRGPGAIPHPALRWTLPETLGEAIDPLDRGV